MRGVNVVHLLGNVGKQPDVRQLQDGSSVANFPLATSEHWKGKDGTKQEKTEWHRIVVFGKLADIVSQYVDKGMPVYVSGSLRTRQWEKDGQKHYTTEIVARELQMLGSAPEKQPESSRLRDREEYHDDDIPF